MKKCEDCKYYQKCLEWNCLKNPEECSYFEPAEEEQAETAKDEEK